MGLSEDREHPQDFLCEVCKSWESLGHHLSKLKISQWLHFNTSGQLAELLLSATLAHSLSEEELEARFWHNEPSQTWHDDPSSSGERF